MIKPMRRGFIGLAVVILAAAAIIGIGAYLGLKAKTQNLGAATSFTPVQAPKTTLSGAGVTTNATSVNLTSLLAADGVSPITNANIGGIGFATIEPGVPKKEENISFTGITQNANGSAQLTGVTRGLLPVAPYTASTTLQLQHSGGSVLILSNSGAFYNQFNIAANTSTISGNWTYGSSSLPKVSADTTNAQISTATNTLATVNYVNSVATSGAANASVLVNGLVQIASSSNLGSDVATGTTGASQVYDASNFSSSSKATIVPVTNASGTLSTGFINQAATANYNFLGGVTFASTTLNGVTNASSVTASTLNVSGTAISAANIYRKVFSPSSTGYTYTSPANSTTTIMSVSLPAAVSTTIYQFSLSMQENGVVNNSTTILINSTPFLSCTIPINQNQVFTGTITMLSSTTLENANVIQYGNANVTGGCADNRANFTINLATTTATLSVQERDAGGATITGNYLWVIAY